MLLFEVEQELAFTRQQFLESFYSLTDCIQKFESATGENTRHFYQTQIHSDKTSLEFWAGQITYLENLISQKKRAAILPATLPKPRKKVFSSERKTSKVA